MISLNRIWCLPLALYWWCRQWYHAAMSTWGPDRCLGVEGYTTRTRQCYSWGVCHGLSLVCWRRFLGKDIFEGGW